MSRPFSLRSSLNTLRAERQAVAAPLVSAGRFDTRAIMREAVKLARSINRSFGSWQYRMGVALRTVWKCAKAAMLEACAAEPFAIRNEPQRLNFQPQLRPAFVRRSTAFVSGSRAFSHGW